MFEVDLYCPYVPTGDLVPALRECQRSCTKEHISLNIIIN